MRFCPRHPPTQTALSHGDACPEPDPHRFPQTTRPSLSVPGWQTGDIPFPSEGRPPQNPPPAWPSANPSASSPSPSDPPQKACLPAGQSHWCHRYNSVWQSGFPPAHTHKFPPGPHCCHECPAPPWKDASPASRKGSSEFPSFPCPAHGLWREAPHQSRLPPGRPPVHMVR